MESSRFDRVTVRAIASESVKLANHRTEVCSNLQYIFKNVAGKHNTITDFKQGLMKLTVRILITYG